MATVEFSASTTPVTTGVSKPSKKDKVLHRVRTVRLRQGVSLRSAARHMKSDVRTLRMQERESTDLTLSELRKWQQALDVPLAELIEETDSPLSRPVLERARLIRLMKTALAIHEQSESAGLQRMSQMIVDQLVEIMPELEDVSPWHTYGQRRSMEEFGRIFERRMSDDFLHAYDESA